MINLFLPLVFILFSSCNPYLNLYEIDEGKIWRSRQLARSNLKMVIEREGISTIINLRGENIGKDWYDKERELANSYGVLMIDIPMSSKRIPHSKDLIALLDAFRNSPRPILVHCAGGADRTGEALAIYQIEYMQKSKKDALKMLTPKYFHFSAIKPAKTYFINEVYKGAEWAYNDYDPCVQQYEFYDQSKCFDEGYFNTLTVEDDS